MQQNYKSNFGHREEFSPQPHPQDQGNQYRPYRTQPNNYQDFTHPPGSQVELRFNESVGGSKSKANFWSLLVVSGVITATLVLVIALNFRQEFFTEQEKSEVEGVSVNSEMPTNNDEAIQEPKEEIQKPSHISLNTLFFGDVFWGRYINDWSIASELQYAYPFSGLNSFEREKYDAWIANLECPVTSEIIPSWQQESLLKFNCLPEYLPEARKWFDAFSLANNHTNNMEEVEGYLQTKKNLDKHNFQYFGHYENSSTEDICEVVSFKGRPEFEGLSVIEKAGNEEALDEEYFVPVALCGYHNVMKLPLDNELAEISKYARYFPTVVMPHQGAEYRLQADDYQTSYFRQMIDLGADAVIGGHTHSVQNTEVYEGRLIVYSLGNFIFDQQFDQTVTSGAVVNLNFSFNYDKNLEEWSDIGESCQIHKDTCLQKAEEKKLDKLDFSIVYDMMASDNSNKLTEKASPELEKLILNQANWKETARELSKKPSINSEEITDLEE
jgi:hypothetical protein